MLIPFEECPPLRRLTLPAVRLVLALVAVTVVGSLLARGVSRYFAGRFALVAASNQGDANAVYQTLLAMEGAGTQALVHNAASNDQRIAREARNVLFVRIDTWLSEYAYTDRPELSRRLQQLAV